MSGLRVEWAVVNDKGQPTNMGRTFATRAEAEGHVAWLVGPRIDEMKTWAQIEQVREDGNMARKALKEAMERRYRIVFRQVSDWTPWDGGPGVNQPEGVWYQARWNPRWVHADGTHCVAGHDGLGHCAEGGGPVHQEEAPT